MVQIIITHVHSYCFAIKLLSGDVLVAVAVVICLNNIFCISGDRLPKRCT